MLVIRVGIQLVRIANREDPDQTASSEAVLSVASMFVPLFCGREHLFEILENFLNAYLKKIQ